ncbi:DNA-binding transcriptional regulator, MarR family [Nocardia amikacinitolerans]|uniref:DNA-binding transcriptional regulator, MarR family n=2 Tax=Nocardia amikacinitolerans TaxID=756689 RepID=A0A285M004_9NOCA|nr:DNA-binding transcriptional regulator, MarR family [Nocardia amikacinitolerans]MCP2299265.1 DNA-binding transcriptional regulator, MarR family [Nocardia amikacinitolerans]SNY89727.1 DNA-binding transcriptional regulator, MarR family [Nocardia amikacinitolerans]
MTKWLDPVEQRAWRAVVALMTRLPSALDTQLQRESGVTHFEYWVLTLLSEEPGHRLQMSDLAHKANASLSRLSHVISKLERMGWAQRSATVGRRGVQAVLTDDGYLKVVEAAPGYLDAVRRLVFDGLDATQKAQLADLSEVLAQRLTEVIGQLASADGAGRRDRASE